MSSEVTTYKGRTFDRVVRHDPRNMRFPLSDLLDGLLGTTWKAHVTAELADHERRIRLLEGPAPQPPKPPPPPAGDVVHPIAVLQDQGQEGECVGYGWSSFIASSPNPLQIVPQLPGQDLETATAERLYAAAQAADGSPPDEQSGASTLGGAKAAQQLGFITAYHWATSVADVEAAIKNGFNVVVGSDWYDGMMDVNADGFVVPTGQIAGGHETCYHGVAADGSWFLIRNSWGRWGINGSGDAKIHRADLAKLFASGNTDACVPVKHA